MSWIQVNMVVDAEQVDKLSNMLEMFLAQAVTTENAGEDEFYEIAFPGTPDWQKVAVTGLFSDQIEIEPIIDFIHSQLQSQSTQEIPTSVSKLTDQNWERVWLNSFKPIKVGHQLWVCPSWCEPEDATARNIILDPGLAFGTGTHATTAMCLHWLAHNTYWTMGVAQAFWRSRHYYRMLIMQMPWILILSRCKPVWKMPAETELKPGCVLICQRISIRLLLKQNLITW